VGEGAAAVPESVLWRAGYSVAAEGGKVLVGIIVGTGIPAL